MAHLTQVLCNRCSSNLIELSKVTEKVAGFSSPIVNIKYRCSNKECQDEADIKLSEALAKRAAQIEAKMLRLAQKA